MSNEKNTLNVFKKKKERSKEFLEHAFARAREILNPRDFALIFQAARAKAGGQIAARNRRERVLLISKSSVENASKAELLAMANRVTATHKQMKAAGSDCVAMHKKAVVVNQELTRRGINHDIELPVEKGFVTGFGEGGMHAHGLDRRNSKTSIDGGHTHAWVLPGTGDVLLSMEDGAHEHSIEGNGLITDISGRHSHKVMLDNGTILTTQLTGEHAHGLMLETTGLDGGHTHTLVLPDKTEVESLTVPKLVDILGDAALIEAILPYSSDVISAMGELAHLKEEIAEHALPTLEEAVDLISKGRMAPEPLFAVEMDDGEIVDVSPGGNILSVSKRMVADNPGDIERKRTQWADIRKHTTQLPFEGPSDAKLLFICSAPNSLELARKSIFAGDDMDTFKTLYLTPLGLEKSQVAVGFAMPVVARGMLDVGSLAKWSDHVVKGMQQFPQARVVAIGRVTRELFKSAGIDHVSMPHPSVVRRKGDSGEVARKVKNIAKMLDTECIGVHDLTSVKDDLKKGASRCALADKIREMRKTGGASCRVIKTADEKQIVYGAVLDPYVVDLQDDWVPPAEIESTAHGFLKKSRVIGFEHAERANAQIVESWIEPYPSSEDYRAALENRPHRVFSRSFGSDTIHSGTWMAGVQLGDEEWELHKQGKLNAFSVGGFSFKSKVTTAVMPEVTFVNLIAAP